MMGSEALSQKGRGGGRKAGRENRKEEKGKGREKENKGYNLIFLF